MNYKKYYNNNDAKKKAGLFHFCSYPGCKETQSLHINSQRRHFLDNHVGNELAEKDTQIGYLVNANTMKDAYIGQLETNNKNLEAINKLHEKQLAELKGYSQIMMNALKEADPSLELKGVAKTQQSSSSTAAVQSAFVQNQEIVHHQFAAPSGPQNLVQYSGMTTGVSTQKGSTSAVAAHLIHNPQEISHHQQFVAPIHHQNVNTGMTTGSQFANVGQSSEAVRGFQFYQEPAQGYPTTANQFAVSQFPAFPNFFAGQPVAAAPLVEDRTLITPKPTQQIVESSLVPSAAPSPKRRRRIHEADEATTADQKSSGSGDALDEQQ